MSRAPPHDPDGFSTDTEILDVFLMDIASIVCKHCNNQRCKNMPYPKCYCQTMNRIWDKVVDVQRIQEEFNVKPWGKG